MIRAILSNLPTRSRILETRLTHDALTVALIREATLAEELLKVAEARCTLLEEKILTLEMAIEDLVKEASQLRTDAVVALTARRF